MDLTFQKNSIDELRQLADADRHSVLIEGYIGCGKSYLARQYAKMLGIRDVMFVQPTVQNIRDVLSASYGITHPVLFCIENLDVGVLSASYALLTFLEEPSQNVYIVVTCRNRFQIPETIISRSTCVSVAQPTLSDIQSYAESKDHSKYISIKSSPVWNGVHALTDVDYVYKMKPEHVDYFRRLKSDFKMTDSISNLSWKLGHYPDNTETNLVFVLNYLIHVIKNKRIQKYAIQCIRELSTSRIATHAVLSKFLFDCKYGE